MDMHRNTIRTTLLIYCATVFVVALNGCSGWRGHSSEDYDAYGDPVRTIGVTWSDEKPEPGIDVDLKPNETPSVLDVPEFAE
jgi:hypothetical protein